MIKFISFLRNTFVVILALITSFCMGFVISNEIFKKALENAFENRKTSRVSYRDFYHRRGES